MYVYNNDSQILKYFIEMSYTWKWFGSMTTTHNLPFFTFIISASKRQTKFLLLKMGGRSIQSLQYTVKFAHAVTSIKQSPVLKGHLFVVLSYKISYELNLF